MDLSALTLTYLHCNNLFCKIRNRWSSAASTVPPAFFDLKNLKTPFTAPPRRPPNFPRPPSTAAGSTVCGGGRRGDPKDRPGDSAQADGVAAGDDFKNLENPGLVLQFKGFKFSSSLLLALDFVTDFDRWVVERWLVFAAQELFSGAVMEAEERLLLRKRAVGDGGGMRAGEFGRRKRVLSILRCRNDFWLVLCWGRVRSWEHVGGQRRNATHQLLSHHCLIDFDFF